MGAILDAADDAIRKTEQLVVELGQVKQGLLHDLLTRGIGDNGEIRDPDSIRAVQRFSDGNAAGSAGSISAGLSRKADRRWFSPIGPTRVSATLDVPFLFVSCVRDGRIFPGPWSVD